MDKRKYIIELPDDEHLISWWTYTGTEDGKQYIDFHEVVKTLYKEPDPGVIKQEAYQRGLAEAWDAVRKIFSMDGEVRETLLHNCFFKDVIENISAFEAVEKIRLYEEQEEIKVGNEVNGKGGRGIITKISDDGDHFNVMWENGSTGYYMREDFKKTGRYFPEIAEVLKKMKGEN